MFTNILKSCGRGVLYIITLPVLLAVLSIYAVIGIVQFVVVGIKSIWYFFTGRNLFGEFPEDVKAREILEGKDVSGTTPEAPMAPTPAPLPTELPPSEVPPQNTMPHQPYITTPSPAPYITTPEGKKEEPQTIINEEENR